MKEQIEKLHENRADEIIARNAMNNLQVGDKVRFETGNYAGMAGIITKVNCQASTPQDVFGFWHEVRLSNGMIGRIEKSEHWELLANQEDIPAEFNDIHNKEFWNLTD